MEKAQQLRNMEC